MSDNGEFKPQIGAIEWYDLTVKNADSVKDFYTSVVGRRPNPMNMTDDDGDYHDFNMIYPDSNETVTGICHVRGVNSKTPAQ